MNKKNKNLSGFLNKNVTQTFEDKNFQDVYLVSLDLTKGGRGIAIQNQTTMFFEMGLKPVILTLAENPLISEELAQLKQNGSVSRATEVISVHEYAREKQTDKKNSSWSLKEDTYNNKLLSRLYSYENNKIIDYFSSQGEHIKSLTFDRDNILNVVSYFKNGFEFMRRVYTQGKFCNKEVYFGKDSNTILEERFYTPDGFCFLSLLMEPETNKIKLILDFDRKMRKVTTYPSLRKWRTKYINEILVNRDNNKKKPILIAQSPSAMRAITGVKRSNAHKIHLIHTNHFELPGTYGSAVQQRYQELFDRNDLYDLTVVLTEAQKLDIQNQFQHMDNIAVVPNGIELFRDVQNVSKVPGRIGVFSQLIPRKQVDLLLKIFPRILEFNKNAHIEIFGIGSEYSNLYSLSNELGIASRVNFNGFVDNVSEEMAKCSLTVSLGDTEALPLSIMESLAAGTPVVALDINYGPNELIIDGETGYLVPRGNTSILTEKINQILADDSRVSRMGTKGYEHIKEKFERNIVLNLWNSLLIKEGYLLVK